MVRQVVPFHATMVCGIPEKLGFALVVVVLVVLALVLVVSPSTLLLPVHWLAAADS